MDSEKTKITKKDFLIKYPIIGINSFNRLEYEKKIIKPCDNTKPKFYYEEDLKKIFHIEKYNSNYIRLNDFAKKYNIPHSTVVDNALKDDSTIFTCHKYFIDEIKFLKKLPQIEINRKKRKKMSVEDLNKKFDEKMGPDYIRQEDIIDKHKKIKVLHTKCGHVVEMTPDNSIYLGTKCPKCNKRSKYSFNELATKIINLTNGIYTLENMDNYITNKKGFIIIRHHLENCKGCKNGEKSHTFKIRVNDFLNGRRCPLMQMSAGEEKIYSFLLKHNILFEQEKSMHDTQNNLFKFDFYLPDKNIYIEFDGIQHFNANTFYSRSQENFDLIKKHDREKDKLIEQRNALLIRISYNNIDNIDEILENIILKNEFNDYPFGEYNQVIGNTVYKNVIYIG